MAEKALAFNIDKRTYGPNEVRHQNARYYAEAGTVVNGDTITITREDSYKEGGWPPLSTVLYTHNKKFTSAAPANPSLGNTLNLLFWDPDRDADLGKEQSSLYDGYRLVSIVFAAGITNIALQVAAINANTEFRKWGYAAATNAGADVSIYPASPNGKVKMGSGSTWAGAAGFPAAELDNGTRLYTLLPITGSAWTMTYDSTPANQKVVITDVSGGTVENVVAVVEFH